VHPPIFLFTDFGSADIYVGQVKAVLLAHAPECPVIDLLNDAPAFDVEASAHLLAALAARLPKRSVVLGVVDPGVGSARGAVALEADGRWFVGPDNGLFSVVSARSESTAYFAIDWVPPPASASFHGRDLFAPAAAAIASRRVDVGSRVRMQPLDVRLSAADTARVIYVDHYGNLVTGLRPVVSEHGATVRIKDTAVCPARVFSAVAPGELFWYENSIGLFEIAASVECASRILSAGVGDDVIVEHLYPDC
jgi:S-adenosylmethionine hydrolase